MSTRLRSLVLGVALLPWGCHCEPAVVSSGEVRSSSGEAIANARVCAWPRRSGRPLSGWRPGCTRTDDAGRFFLDLVEGTFEVIADAEGFLPDRHHAFPAPVPPWLTVTAQHPPTGIDVVLHPGGQWHQGRLVDPEGAPVGGGTVILYPLGNRQPLMTLATTDADGRYRAWAQPGVRVNPAAEGYALFESIERDESGESELVLLPESRIRGWVVMPSGLPVSGARVTVSDFALAYGATEFATRTDALGRFEIVGLPPGKHGLLAHTERLAGGHEPLQLGLGQTSPTVTIRLDRTLASLRARVVDVEGAPVPHCRVNLRSDDGGNSTHVGHWFRTDGRGHLDLQFVEGKFRLGGLICPGYAGQPPYPGFELTQGAATAVHWQVDRGTTFRGRLVTHDGRPAADRSLSLSPEDPALDNYNFFVSDVRVRPQTDGSFELRGLRQGTYHVWASLGATHGDLMVEVGGSELPVTVSLPPMGRLELEIPGATDETGIGITRCEPTTPAAANGSAPGAIGYVEAGRVVFDDVAVGRYQVGVLPRNPECERDHEASWVEVRADETTRRAWSRPKAAVTHTISGVVTGPDGEPRAGAVLEYRAAAHIDVTPWDGGFRGKRTVSDRAGRFSFSSVAPGRYVVRAVVPGLEALADADTEQDDSAVQLRLR